MTYVIIGSEHTNIILKFNFIYDLSVSSRPEFGNSAPVTFSDSGGSEIITITGVSAIGQHFSEGKFKLDVGSKIRKVSPRLTLNDSLDVLPCAGGNVLLRCCLGQSRSVSPTHIMWCASSLRSAATDVCDELRKLNG